MSAPSDLSGALRDRCSALGVELTADGTTPRVRAPAGPLAGGADFGLVRDRLDLCRIERRKRRLGLAEFGQDLAAPLQFVPVDVRRAVGPRPLVRLANGLAGLLAFPERQPRLGNVETAR